MVLCVFFELLCAITLFLKAITQRFSKVLKGNLQVLSTLRTFNFLLYKLYTLKLQVLSTLRTFNFLLYKLYTLKLQLLSTSITLNFILYRLSTLSLQILLQDTCFLIELINFFIPFISFGIVIFPIVLVVPLGVEFFYGFSLLLNPSEIL